MTSHTDECRYHWRWAGQGSSTWNHVCTRIQGHQNAHACYCGALNGGAS